MNFLLILKSNTDSAEVVSKTMHKEIQLNDVACELWLHELSYHKKIFQPGMVLARLQLKRTEYPKDQKNIGIPTDVIINHFKDNQLKVTRDGMDVAADYYIYKVIPEFRRDSDSNQYVELTCYCYSRDHKLTLQPYSKMYTNKKFVGDVTTAGNEGIIQSEMNGILQKAGFDEKKIDCSNLRFLRYITKPEKKDENGNIVQAEERKEFIQPYLVQYNESFYDFIARTANRCGEFLYHDEGKLHIGMPVTPSDKIRTIDDQKVYAYRYQSYGEPIIQPSPMYADSMAMGEKQQGKGLYAANADYFYYDELPIDEYLGLVLTKDSFSSFSDELLGMTRRHIEAFSNFLTKPSYAEVIGAIAGAEVTFALIANTSADVKNSDGNKKYIDSATEDHKDGDRVRVYGSMLNSEVQGYNYDHAQNLNNKFYQFVSKCSHNISKTLIEVETGVESPVFRLGEEVKFNNQSCIVISVEEDLMSDRTEEVARGQRLVLAPLYTAPVNDAKTSISLYCPPPMVPFTREVGIQRAFVARNGDPQGLGRVCIRYPWQKESDEPSPWVRVAVPFAPNDPPVAGAGFFFEPKVGDEVVVDYENGNIEHPIITGSLFSPRNAAPSSAARETMSLKTGRVRKIMSEKGHSIAFTDTDMASQFVNSFWPGYKILTSLVGAGFGADLHFGENDSVSGGIELCDSWGMYRITASATDRNISIMSPFGDVQLSAFTGITISAPNGDVNIKGKNVTIQAGNELKLVSGYNIDETYRSWGEYFGDFLTAVIADGVIGGVVAPLTDFTLIRTVYETFLKPVAGTLTIHSGRYLLLNAGGAHAEIPNKGLTLSGIHSVERDNSKMIKLTQSLRTINTIVDTLMQDYISNYTAIYEDWDALQKLPAFARMQSPTPESIINMGFNNTSVHSSDFSFTNGPLVSNTDFNNLYIGINNLRIRIQRLYKLVNEFFDGTKLGENEDGKAIFTKSLKKALKKLSTSMYVPTMIKNIKEKNEKFTDLAPSFDATKKDRILMRRYLTEQLIIASEVLDRDPAKVLLNPTMFTSASDYLNDKTWNEYIDQLVPYGVDIYHQLPTRESIAKWFMSIFPAAGKVLQHDMMSSDWLKERYLWDTCKQGEILMSDKNGKDTISIVNGALTRTPNEDGFMEQSKDILRTL